MRKEKAPPPTSVGYPSLVKSPYTDLGFNPITSCSWADNNGPMSHPHLPWKASFPLHSAPLQHWGGHHQAPSLPIVPGEPFPWGDSRHLRTQKLPGEGCCNAKVTSCYFILFAFLQIRGPVSEAEQVPFKTTVRGELLQTDFAHTPLPISLFRQILATPPPFLHRSPLESLPRFSRIIRSEYSEPNYFNRRQWLSEPVGRRFRNLTSQSLTPTSGEGFFIFIFFLKEVGIKD